MKNLILILAILVSVSNLTVVAASTYDKKPAKKDNQVNVSNKTTQVYKQDGSNYLLKYNIDDLEAAPWLNNGKRVYKNEAK